MFRTLYIALLLITPIALLAKPPGRVQDKPEVAPKPAPVMKLVGNTNWGRYVEVGPGQFTLEDHPIWYAVGRVREDGKVFVLWTHRNTDDICPGVYEIQPDGSLAGVWGYSHLTKVEPSGELTGTINVDRVFVLPPPEPEI